MAFVDNKEKFIEMVSRYRYLFDLNDAGYKNKKLKARTWEQIGSSFGISGHKAQSKFKSIKDYYFRLKKLQEQNVSGKEDQYRNWLFYSAVDRLLNETDKSEICENAKEDMSEQTDSSSSMSILPSTPRIDIVDKNGIKKQSRVSFLGSRLAKSHKRSFSENEESEEQDEELGLGISIIEKDELSEKNNTEEKIEDEITHFSKFVEFGVRKLPYIKGRKFMKKMLVELIDLQMESNLK